MARFARPIDGPEDDARVAVVENESIRFGKNEQAVEDAVVRDVDNGVRRLRQVLVLNLLTVASGLVFVVI